MSRNPLIDRICFDGFISMETIFYLLIVAFAALSCIVLYLIHINNAFRVTPDEALQISPHRWTVEEIKETYERICKNPIDPTKHLPPNLGRRYIVTGSSGKAIKRGEDICS
jgi:hypothetical protein